jgi:hypothetical protein
MRLMVCFVLGYFLDATQAYAVLSLNDQAGFLQLKKALVAMDGGRPVCIFL